LAFHMQQSGPRCRVRVRKRYSPFCASSYSNKRKMYSNFKARTFGIGRQAHLLGKTRSSLGKYDIPTGITGAEVEPITWSRLRFPASK
jgi:hypothetical protein